MEKPSISDWIEAMRLRTLPLSLSSILAGSAIVTDKSAPYISILILAILTTIALQILSNLANDYGDTQNGADGIDRVGPARAVQTGTISANQMKRAIYISGVLAFGLGTALVLTRFLQTHNWVMISVFIALGIGAIAAAVKYTAGKNPYGYRGMGDLFVFLFFGFVGVGGTYFLLQNQLHWSIILLSTTIGAFSTAVLNLNNMRDIHSDSKAGKRTLVVIMGPQKAKAYHFSLVTIGWLSLIIHLLLFRTNNWMWLTLIFLPIHTKHLVKVYNVTIPSEFDGELKLIALSTFGISLLLFILTYL
ncbi:MAG: 1,4-dihydroxy-2-naphthoate octaprenyltransferase [Flavobacteriales bacterium]|jgi:1,4-dihydroxy-2-naphthoate octaprenyltransferase